MNELLIVAVGLLWVLVLVLAALLFALARQVGVLYERVAPAGALAMNQHLVVGDDAPVVQADRLRGEPLVIGGASSAGRSTLLFFLSPTCPVCETLLPALKSIASREGSWCDLVFASDGGGHEPFVADHRLEAYSYVVSQELGVLYGVSKLPYAALVDEVGKIAGFGLVSSREHIESLFEAKERGVESIQAYLSIRNAETAVAGATGSES
jgi:methylamine dehydrogenase accessory protein MauD